MSSTGLSPSNGVNMHASSVAPQEFWLAGGSVMCACPDCGAPMSIRLWLMVADCWMCGTSIELTEEQEQQIHSMLTTSDVAVEDVAVDRPLDEPPSPPLPGRQYDNGRGTTQNHQAAPHHVPDRDSPTRHPVLTPRSQPPLPQPKPSTLRESVLGPVPATRVTPRRLRDWLQHMPAWLMSLLFHMALLALLALLMFEGEKEDQYITLSTEANQFSATGGDIRIQNPDDELHYDEPLPDKDTPKSFQERKAMVRADQDARELRVDPTASVPQLPTLQKVKQTLRSKNVMERTLAARDPRVRVDIVKQEGGTTLTEAAVARGLRWMSHHQNRDGSWSLHRFHRVSDCRNQCRGQGSVRSDSAATSLCLLPFLGAGQTHQTGIYRDTVSRGLRWMLQMQEPDGDLRGDSQGNAGMYAHGQGAIVLCEAYALTRDEQLRVPAQRAINFIVNAQHLRGGWRYAPKEEGDTSVLGWQLMALQSARAAELDVPPETMELANMFLDSVQYDEGSRYAYQPSHRPTHVMTAEALLCRMYLGWKKDFPGVRLGVSYLSDRHAPGQDGTNFYYWYYATQVMHHYGGRPWKQWNIEMRDILVSTQETRGHAAGSWEPQGGHASKGGRLYATALAVCTLEVYYRHAPIFRQIELD